MPLRIAIVVSHPIQHFCPQYASFARNGEVALKVFFGSMLGYRAYRDQNFGAEIAWDNLRLEEFDHVFLNGEAVLAADRQLDAPGLEAELEAFGPDLVVGYGYFQPLQRRAKRWAVKQAVPYAYISDGEGRQQRRGIKQLVRSFMLERYFKNIDIFLTVGDANEAYYRAHGVPASRMLRMHFPIDVEAYRKAREQQDLLRNGVRQSMGIPGGAVVLCVAGKLVSWKRQEDIIRAMGQLEKVGVYLHLLVLGSGAELEALKQLAAGLTHSQVHFPGFVPIGELPAYYAATDIYVHPAEVEPHSIAVSEAIYMGCPVVMSDRCGSYGDSDDVQPGRNGIVYPCGDIPQLAEAINGLTQDAGLRSAYSLASRQIAEAAQERAHQGILPALIAKTREVSIA